MNQLIKHEFHFVIITVIKMTYLLNVIHSSKYHELITVQSREIFNIKGLGNDFFLSAI